MEERRQDYPDIISKLDMLQQGQDNIIKDMSEVKIHSAEIAVRVEERNNSAIEWRDSVCKKFTDMRSYCNSRQENKIKIWLAIIGTIVVGLIGWGETHRQVVINTGRLDRLEEPLFKI